MNVVSTINDIVPQNFTGTTDWLRYFNPHQALAAVAAHVAGLPSSRTPERYTESVYSDSLKYFLNWCGCRLETTSANYQRSSLREILAWSMTSMPLPTADLVTAYAAHLAGRGLKSNTIAQKYFAPLRHYIKALIRQLIPLTGAEREYVSDCRDHMRNALEVKPPRCEITSHLSPLYQHGIRLELIQVNGILRAIDRTTRTGLRDYALLHCAFSTGLRLAEIKRMTLNSITREGQNILVTVRGKRNNLDPIPITPQLHADILAYVEAHNSGLPDGDPRRIGPDTPLWQPYLHGDNYMAFSIKSFDPQQKGFSQDGIRAMFRRRVESVCDLKSRSGSRFSAHDTRRTFAYLADSAGMKRKDISAAMRHANTATTDNYIGQAANYSDWLLGTRVKFG